MDAALIPALHDALVVAQTGSVREAARRLHKTSSAVSQQLRRIEARFGVPLFEKAGRGLRPSAPGLEVLGRLTRLFDEAASLEAQLEELAGAKVATLRVAASDYLGELLELRLERRRLVEQARQAAQHREAGGARAQPPPGLLEQRDAEARLHTAELLGHRRGGLVQAARRLAHRAGLGHDQRVVEGRNQGRIHR